MITHPSTQEILQAVIQWIEDVRPRLEERDAFLARVAGHALATVQRELSQGPTAQAASVSRLTRLLTHDGTYDALQGELSDRLARGELNLDTPGLLAVLRAEVTDRLMIDQPGYRHDPSHEGSVLCTADPTRAE